MNNDQAILREARPDELDAMIELYRHLHADDPPPPARPQLERIWQSIREHPGLHYLVAEVAGRIVSSCTLSIIPNLTRGARPYGVVENVVTHRDHRKRGHATALLRRAQKIAWDAGCYKVMLMTGSKDPATLRFYEQAGFRPDVKTAYFISDTDAAR